MGAFVKYLSSPVKKNSNERKKTGMQASHQGRDGRTARRTPLARTEVLPRLSGFLTGRVNLGRALARLRQLFPVPQQAGSTSCWQTCLGVW